MTESRIAYTARPDITPEAESSALAAVYKFVLDCHAKKEAAPESRPDAAKESMNVSRPKHHIR